MVKEQLIQALLTIQSCRANFSRLVASSDIRTTPQTVVMTSVMDLYSDDLLEYINKNLQSLPSVDFFNGTFNFADFFGLWPESVSKLGRNPCVLVGRSGPICDKKVPDVSYESFIGTYIDSTGFVFNAEVRQYSFKVGYEFSNLVTRVPCGGEVFRLDEVEQFFPERYMGFWNAT